MLYTLIRSFISNYCHPVEQFLLIFARLSLMVLDPHTVGKRLTVPGIWSVQNRTVRRVPVNCAEVMVGSTLAVCIRKQDQSWSS